MFLYVYSTMLWVKLMSTSTGSLKLGDGNVLLFIIFFFVWVGRERTAWQPLLLAPSYMHVGFNALGILRETEKKLIKTFFGIYLIMYKLFRRKINPQFLRLEKRKDELLFWMPGSLYIAAVPCPWSPKSITISFSSWMNNRSGGLGYVHVK